jgi:DNA-binding IscR family transcriptional regulator
MGLQLLVQKAMDENGEKMFSSGEIAELKNEVRDSDLQRILLALVEDDLVSIDQGN